MTLTADGAGSNNVTPVAKGIPSCRLSRIDSTAKKRVIGDERVKKCNCLSRVCLCDDNGWKRRKFVPRVGSPPDVLSYYNSNEGLDLNKYGSATKDIEALIALRESYKMSNQVTHSTNASKALNVERNPSNDLRAKHASLPNIIILEDDDVPTKKSVASPVIIDLEDEDLSSKTPSLETNIKQAVDVILIKDVDLNIAQDQWLSKENSCSSGETETKKEQDVDLGVGSKDVMEVTNGPSDLSCESLTKNIEVDQDLGIDVAAEADSGFVEHNEKTLPYCEGLANISEINEDEGIDPRQKAEGGRKVDHGLINVNYGGLPKISEVNMDKVVDLVVGVDTEMEGDNEQTAANFECSAKISESNKENGVYVGFKYDNGQVDFKSGSQLEISQINKDKGVYVGVQDDEEVEADNGQLEASDDDIANIWNEMKVALECSKDTGVDCLKEKCAVKDVELCDHLFILKEDIGYVCRICGLIQKAIETIIEFQYAKGKRSGRTYPHGASSGKDLEQTKTLPGGVKFAAHNYSAFELTIHPRHRKIMKPHQVEGFNFLLSNLVSDNPGGCIMAHAPGSGKTFMIISFLQSFMAKYPAASPLIVLPRGIVSTWKNEFRRWQVEDIPLYDFYSSKADSRSQQLEVLQKWTSERSILFLSYKQFSSIVCHTDNGKVATECEEILLTWPSVLILDEGHTPRNQNTDILMSLEKVQTPRKVVLSGTLYQNHVEEVFNILNLVRPRFLKLEASKIIKSRILSRLQIQSRKSSLVKFTNNDFYEAVEYSLLKDKSFVRKVTVIRDLREMTSKVLHYYKGDSLDELPGLVDFTIFLELSPKQKKEVTELKKMKNRFKRNSDGSNIYVHPLLKTLSMNDGVKERVDEKIDLILEKLDDREGVKAKFYLNLLRLCESTGEKLLVFSQYLLPLKFLERLTVKVMSYSPGKEIFMITGDSDSNLRDTYMEQFNNSSAARVFFGSIKACGEGISLVGASRIIVLDVHLNPSVTRQAIGRAFRPGQERKVYIYRLVASDSPEVDDNLTCFRKETISKMWFEWNGCLGEDDFEMETVNLKDPGDLFLGTPRLSEDVISVFKR